MRDHLRCYRAIRDALTPGSPGQLNGHVARHLTTLTALLRGSVGSTRTPLPHRATPVPEGRKPARRVTRWPRGLDTERIVEALDF